MENQPITSLGNDQKAGEFGQTTESVLHKHDRHLNLLKRFKTSILCYFRSLGQNNEWNKKKILKMNFEWIDKNGNQLG